MLVAFDDWDGPQLLPVSFVYWTDDIVFRTVINSYELSQVWTNPELVPLAAGHRPPVIAIEPRTISGRELRF